MHYDELLHHCLTFLKDSLKFFFTTTNYSLKIECLLSKLWTNVKKYSDKSCEDWKDKKIGIVLLTQNDFVDNIECFNLSVYA